MMLGKLPRTVLIVDDEPLIRWSVSEALSDAGWLVRQASTGAEARVVVDQLAGQPFVILLDLRLPDVADLSLMRDLRDRRPDVPLILMTAYGTQEQALTAHDSGVFRVLDKPFDVRTVVSLLDEAYTSAQWRVDESWL
jgi:DNA-binding NtrC family response regulator